MKLNILSVIYLVFCNEEDFLDNVCVRKSDLTTVFWDEMSCSMVDVYEYLPLSTQEKAFTLAVRGTQTGNVHDQ